MKWWTVEWWVQKENSAWQAILKRVGMAHSKYLSSLMWPVLLLHMVTKYFFWSCFILFPLFFVGGGSLLAVFTALHCLQKDASHTHIYLPERRVLENAEMMHGNSTCKICKGHLWHMTVAPVRDTSLYFLWFLLIQLRVWRSQNLYTRGYNYMLTLLYY